MPASIDLTGEQFGRLTALHPVASSQSRRRWMCRCDCGREVAIITSNLRRGNSKACGHCSGKTQGAYKTAEFQVWRAMLRRCDDPKAKNFDRYGGRGIAVCQRWKDSFDAFLQDMGPRPSDSHSIERMNNAGPYEPANCRWALPAEQARNRRNTRIVVYEGEQMCMLEAIRRSGIPESTVWSRQKRGWPEARLFEPPR